MWERLAKTLGLEHLIRDKRLSLLLEVNVRSHRLMSQRSLFNYPLGNILFEAMRHFIDALLRNSMGKIQKNAIRQQYA
jgi:hypothetical protein